MVTVPMLADFAVRLALGLVLALTLTSWRAVPLRFFRLQSQIVLGVLVLAALAQASAARSSTLAWLLVAGAAASYLATVTWGLGLPALARALDAVVVLVCGAWLILVSRGPDPSGWAWLSASRWISGLLLGATLHSMLLGHYYLIAPAMTTAPLTRSLDLILCALVARCLLEGLGIWARSGGLAAASWGGGAPSDVTFLSMRWGMGVVGASVSVFLARRTAAIRSTQSATGILYVTSIFVLFGELASMSLGGRGWTS
jgi:hypothetical protein